jgi:hypothetical protein
LVLIVSGPVMPVARIALRGALNAAFEVTVDMLVPPVPVTTSPSRPTESVPFCTTVTAPPDELAVMPSCPAVIAPKAICVTDTFPVPSATTPLPEALSVAFCRMVTVPPVEVALMPSPPLAVSGPRLS